MESYKSDDEYLPKCPNCRGENFTLINNRYIERSDSSIAMVICSSTECQTVVGVLPIKDAWNNKKD